MKKYLENIVIPHLLDEEGFILTGTELTDPYRLLFMKMDRKGNILTKKRFGSGPRDYEGHYICSTDDGYLICGCSDGIADEEGGSDWKIYLLEVDDSGNKIRDRSIRMNGNECAYDLELLDDEIILTGVTRKEGKSSSLFVIRLDQAFDVKSSIVIGDFKGAMPIRIEQDGEGFYLTSSLRRGGKNQIFIHRLSEDLEVEDEDVITEGYALFSEGVDGDTFLGGNKENEQYLLRLDGNGDILFEKTYEEGKLTYLIPEKEGLLIGGYIKKGDSIHPCLYKIRKNGEIISRKTWNKKGLIEKTMKVGEGYLLDIHLLGKSESTEFIVKCIDDILD